MKSSPQHSHVQAVFADHPVAAARPEQYAELVVDAKKLIAAWRQSLMAHELLDGNGFIKGDMELSEGRLEKRMVVRKKLGAGEALEKPILGVGIFDNVEIGAGSDTIATLVMEGVTIIPVHVRRSQIRDFEALKA